MQFLLSLQGLEETAESISTSIDLTIESPFSLSSHYRTPPSTSALILESSTEVAPMSSLFACSDHWNNFEKPLLH